MTATPHRRVLTRVPPPRTPAALDATDSAAREWLDAIRLVPKLIELLDECADLGLPSAKRARDLLRAARGIG